MRCWLISTAAPARSPTFQGLASPVLLSDAGFQTAALLRVSATLDKIENHRSACEARHELHISIRHFASCVTRTVSAPTSSVSAAVDDTIFQSVTSVPSCLDDEERRLRNFRTPRIHVRLRKHHTVSSVNSVLVCRNVSCFGGPRKRDLGLSAEKTWIQIVVERCFVNLSRQTRTSSLYV